MSEEQDSFVPLRQWAREHRLEPSLTPLNGVHTFGPIAVIEQIPRGTVRPNRRGTDIRKTWPKVRRLRRPLPDLAGHR